MYMCLLEDKWMSHWERNELEDKEDWLSGRKRQTVRLTDRQTVRERERESETRTGVMNKYLDRSLLCEEFSSSKCFKQWTTELTDIACLTYPSTRCDTPLLSCIFFYPPQGWKLSFFCHFFVWDEKKKNLWNTHVQILYLCIFWLSFCVSLMCDIRYVRLGVKQPYRYDLF